MQLDPAKVTWDTPGPVAAPSTAVPAAAPVASPQAAVASPSAAPASIDPAQVQWDQPATAPAPPESAQAPAPRSPISELARQAGLTVRAGVQGAANLAGIPADAIGGVANEALDAVRGPGNGARFPRTGEAVSNLMDSAGLPKPANALERVVQDAAGGVATAATGIGAGQAVARISGPISRAVSQAFTTAPMTQAVSSAAAGGASGVAREGGAGAGGQVAAGLAAGVLPTALPAAAAGAVRRVIRGGEEGRVAMQETIKTFDQAAGVSPTVGQATGSRAMQAIETGLTNVVGSSGVMARAGEAQAEAMARSVRQLADNLAPGASGMDAGEAIARGVQKFKGDFKTRQGQLYGALDQHIPAATPISVDKTQGALQDLLAGIPGAENLSKFFRNAKIGDIERAMLADLELAAKAQAPVGMSSAGAAAKAGQLPYEAIKKLRTLVGQELSDNSLTSSVPASKWRALYGALSEDLGVAATGAGPRAQQAWERANAFTRAGMTRMEQLETIVSRDAPEKVFRAALSGTNEGGTTIRRVMRSLPVESRREVAAAALQRLGRAAPGKQNELGDEFSSETFLTNLAKMSPQARQAIFGSLGVKGLEHRINQLGRLAATRREGSQVFANPSGTARQAGLLGWGATLIGGLASGNSGAISAALAAPVVSNVAARLTTNAPIVNWFAKPTTLQPATGPAAIESIAASTPDSGQPKVYRSYPGAARELRRSGAAGEVRQAPGGGFVIVPVKGYADGGLVDMPSELEPVETISQEESAQIRWDDPKRDDIDARAHEAASSPLNDRKEPSEKQAAAGNYKVGKLRLHGLDISIENPQGSTRRGKDPDGTPWESEMVAGHYGYIKGTKGADKDHLDVFLGPDMDSKLAFVIDQVKPGERSFDEHKAVLGAANEQEAREIYLAAYPDGWTGLGAITQLPMAAFRAWAMSGKLRKPLGDIEQPAAAELETTE